MTEMEPLNDEKLRLRRFQVEELEKGTKNFSADCLLGSGAFGNANKGTFEVEGTLAIKRAHAESYQSVEEFRNGPKGAKYWFMNMYHMVLYLSISWVGRGGGSLTWRQRVNITIGAAKGFKVSDFGLVKMGPIGDQSHVNSQIKGTPGYLDPAYCTSFHSSPFSGVYSFGVILLQLTAARLAMDSSRSHPNYHIIDWMRPSIERGHIEEILETILLSRPCNMDMMLTMGELGLRRVAKMPKDRPTMTQVWQELENTLYSLDNLIDKQPLRRSKPTTTPMFPRPTEQGHHRSFDQDYSQSFVSIDGVGFQKFHVELDSISSKSLRCFEFDSASIDMIRRK
ncbi:hypothetical protein F3Y22_tig00110159pilonHSYRG00193 [Hibiscus syriacus]|uniref:non-specific serine/threonine protein kinase n=1 Tax=Hibiscus syriacus TaxID=106335 RepID=A0A6A3BGX2_HIBSY|nr:hypothetical protein F3Y22_tig00110159pilonHSYRG00193 [Hibiscus syriacus]